MIETIPNPLTDAQVKRDIDDMVASFMSRKNVSFNSLNDLQHIFQSALRDIARRAFGDGFRMGWQIRERRGKL